MNEYDDHREATEAFPSSPAVDQMRQYVDIERSIRRMEDERRKTADQLDELRAKSDELRSRLTEYLKPDSESDAAIASLRAKFGEIR